MQRTIYSVIDSEERSSVPLLTTASWHFQSIGEEDLDKVLNNFLIFTKNIK